jgi:hypothetical protein
LPALTFLKTEAWAFGGGYDFAGRASPSEHNFFVRAKLSF